MDLLYNLKSPDKECFKYLSLSTACWTWRHVLAHADPVCCQLRSIAKPILRAHVRLSQKPVDNSLFLAFFDQLASWVSNLLPKKFYIYPEIFVHIQSPWTIAKVHTEPFRPYVPASLHTQNLRNLRQLYLVSLLKGNWFLFFLFFPCWFFSLVVR